MKGNLSLSVSRPSFSVCRSPFHNLSQICRRWKLPSCKFREKITCWNGFRVSREAALQLLMWETKHLLSCMVLLQWNKLRNLGAFSSCSPWIYSHFCHTLLPASNMLADLFVSLLCSKLFFSFFSLRDHFDTLAIMPLTQNLSVLPPSPASLALCFTLVPSFT